MEGQQKAALLFAVCPEGLPVAAPVGVGVTAKFVRNSEKKLQKYYKIY